MKLAPFVLLALLGVLLVGVLYLLGSAPGAAEPGAGLDGQAAEAAPSGDLEDVPIASGGDRPLTAVRTLLPEDRDQPDLPPDELLTDWIRVRVEVDGTGAPVPDAVVRLRSGTRQGLPVAFADFSKEVKSDPTGTAEFRVPPMAVFTASARKAGFAVREMSPVLSGDVVTLRLKPGHGLLGRVVDARAGVPIAGATIRALAPGVEEEVTTDEDGSFQIADLGEGLYLVAALAPGYDIHEVPGVQVGRSASAPLELALNPGVLLKGRVVDALTGDAVIAARVQVVAEREHTDAEALMETTVETTAAGSFEVVGASRRGATLVVEAAGYATHLQQLIVAPGDDEANLEVKLYPGSEVAGVLLGPDGAPVAGGKVRIGGVSRWDVAERTVTTDAEGRFRFKQVRPGVRFQLVGVSRDPTLAPGFLGGLTVQVNQDLDGLLIPLVLGGRIAGTVIDARNNPVPRARVVVDGLSDLVWRAMGCGPILYAEQDGTFELEGLPEQPISLAASLGEVVSNTLDVHVLAGGDHKDLRLRLIHGLVLEGLVLSTAGAPIDDVLVSAYAQDKDLSIPEGRLQGKGQARAKNLIEKVAGKADAGARILNSVTAGKASTTAFRSVARTDSSGRFQLAGLDPADRLALVLEHEDYATLHEFNVPVTVVGLQLKMTPLLSLTGRVTEAGTRRPITRFVIQARPVRPPDEVESLSEALALKSAVTSAFQSADGTFKLTGLKPGRYDVTARADGYKKMEPEVLGVSASTPPLDLELAPAAIVAGVVRGPDGTPIERIPVFLRPAGEEEAPKPGKQPPPKGPPQGPAKGAKGGKAANAGKPPAGGQTPMTNERGEFVFTDLDAGTFLLGIGQVSKPLIAPVQVDVPAGGRVERELRLEAVGRVDVEVRGPNGFALPDAFATARGNQTGLMIRERTDASGLARFANLPPDTYTVICSHPDCKSKSNTVHVQANDQHSLTYSLDSK